MASSSDCRAPAEARRNSYTRSTSSQTHSHSHSHSAHEHEHRQHEHRQNSTATSPHPTDCQKTPTQSRATPTAFDEPSTSATATVPSPSSTSTSRNGTGIPSTGLPPAHPALLALRPWDLQRTDSDATLRPKKGKEGSLASVPGSLSHDSEVLGTTSPADEVTTTPTSYSSLNGSDNDTSRTDGNNPTASSSSSCAEIPSSSTTGDFASLDSSALAQSTNMAAAVAAAPFNLPFAHHHQRYPISPLYAHAFHHSPSASASNPSTNDRPTTPTPSLTYSSSSSSSSSSGSTFSYPATSSPASATASANPSPITFFAAGGGLTNTLKPVSVGVAAMMAAREKGGHPAIFQVGAGSGSGIGTFSLPAATLDLGQEREFDPTMAIEDSGILGVKRRRIEEETDMGDDSVRRRLDGCSLADDSGDVSDVGDAEAEAEAEADEDGNVSGETDPTTITSSASDGAGAEADVEDLVTVTESETETETNTLEQSPPSQSSSLARSSSPSPLSTRIPIPRHPPWPFSLFAPRALPPRSPLLPGDASGSNSPSRTPDDSTTPLAPTFPHFNTLHPSHYSHYAFLAPNAPPSPSTAPSSSAPTPPASSSSSLRSVPLDGDDEPFLVQPPNFAPVAPLVYRSSFPKKNHFEFLKTLGLKTVLTLVQEEYPEDNRKFLEEEGIDFFQLGIPGNKHSVSPVPVEKVRTALELVLDTSRHPLLIHCNKGRHRTGTLVGCLRKVQDWPLGPTLEEYGRFANPKEREHDKLFIEGFDVRPVIKAAPEATFPLWACSASVLIAKGHLASPSPSRSESPMATARHHVETPEDAIALQAEAAAAFAAASALGRPVVMDTFPSGSSTEAETETETEVELGAETGPETDGEEIASVSEDVRGSSAEGLGMTLEVEEGAERIRKEDGIVDDSGLDWPRRGPGTTESNDAARNIHDSTSQTSTASPESGRGR